MKLILDLSSGSSLVTEVAASDADAGRQLLDRLAVEAARLAPGEQVDAELDWAIVRLRAEKRVVCAEEPDYGGDARSFRPSLAVTASIESAQHRLIGLLNIDAQPVQAEQFVHVSNQAMGAASVVGYRRDERESPFTGWEIVSTAHAPESASFGYYMVRELAALRPAWMIGLPLPVGWAFRFAGDTLVDCVSAQGVTLAVGISVDGMAP